VAVGALVLYAAALAAAVVAVWRRPVLAVFAFVVGLALHNAVMALLYGIGVRGAALTVIQAWKEVLLAVALARVARDAFRARALPFRPGPVDVLALAFGALVVLYALLPQEWLGGEADAKTVLYGLRHDGACVAAYFLGRSLVVPHVRSLILATAAAIAAAGLIEVYAFPIEWWRDANVADYFNKQLGFDFHGPARLPENFVFNTGDENNLLRRLVSTFLSPLGTAYMLVVALCLWAVRPRTWWPLAAIAYVGLLFTFTRAALLALAGALVVLALARRTWWPVTAAVVTFAVGAVWTQVYPSIAPETHWFPADLAYQREQARIRGVPPGETVSLDEPSIRSHLSALRDGIETVAEHPQGFGLGNAGETALRRGVELKAGESTYTELGVGTGLLGALVFIAWNLALLWGLIRRGAAGTAAALAAVLALGVQTDVLGTPWLAFVVWILAGTRLGALGIELVRERRPLVGESSQHVVDVRANGLVEPDVATR
jgi:O-antigen ligase/polysaccharide polymerase Wzy-like membrane protein